MDNKKIFNLKQIEVACIIGSPIVAGILISHNYKMFGERQKGFLWIIIGILWTFGLFGIAMFIPENIVDSTRMVIPVLNGLILYPIINRLQGDKIKEHFDNEGAKGSNWIVAGLTALIAAMILIPIILLDKVSPINQYTRQEFNSNGIYYNYDMPIDEVNKLGGILQRIEYFNTESPAEAVFLSTDTTYEFKLITEKDFFNDNTYLSDIKQIFKHVGRYDFKRPLSYKITDPYLADDKLIELNNYDSILILLESVLFTQNPNFKLIYDKSINKNERDKFQRLIMDMGRTFPIQNRFDFLMDYESDTYYLRLFIPKQNWSSPQLISEVKHIKQRLNNFGFNYPFRLVLVDNSTMEIEENEIQ